jgi:glycosyltransferase involved in cell wall biosynthesis
MFDFIKYIQPANYYRLVGQMKQTVLFQDTVNEPSSNPYSNKMAMAMDRLYLNLQSGLIPSGTQQRNSSQDITITNVQDNYTFVRRYFSLIQLIYVFIVRILILKNPLMEVSGLFYALFKVKRERIIPQKHGGWDLFESEILKEKPLVSIIIPTLNRYKYLKDVLADLESQNYKNFEVIVVDQSEPVNESFYNNWKLNITLIQQEEKALWLARNKAVIQSTGDYILLFDDDSRVDSDWIQNHLKCLDYFRADISAGVTHTLVGGGLGRKDKYFHLSDVFDTGNSMVHKSVFKKVGLFDRQFEKQRMGDSEFGLRSLLSGFNLISNPYAKRIHLKVETGGLRQMGSWDALRPSSLFAPRPVPSVLYLIRKYHSSKEAIYYLLKNIPQSYMPYKFKKNKIMRLIYGFVFPLFLPIAIVAVVRSWKWASEKIEKGAMIAELN